MSIPVVAIFDIGKTNKKLFIFDESYKIVFEQTSRLEEIADEDGYPCEDVGEVKTFVRESLSQILNNRSFEVKAVNISAYGASFVCVDENGTPLCPLYNYLKPYPERLAEQFYRSYGGEAQFSQATASPALGSLNSGLQLYRMKYEKPQLFQRVKHALHLPQYLAFLISGKFYSDITSIGCHTGLWNFERGRYHEWVSAEGILEKLAPIVATTHAGELSRENHHFKVGVGIHDSSAALIPYLKEFNGPFALVSTGTWNITLNPFNHSALTSEELQSDCLCYLSYENKPVKASRFFAGHEYDAHMKFLLDRYKNAAPDFNTVEFDPGLLPKDDNNDPEHPGLPRFENHRHAYHQLMYDLVRKQFRSTSLALRDSPVKKIFVDGGFSQNAVFMNLMARFFPDVEVYGASMSQGSALGTALALHGAWSEQPPPEKLVALRRFTAQ
jgi:sugar (pentulose or hexulose) kinase